MVLGDPRFGVSIRGAEAIRKWVLRSNPGMSASADRWTVLRHGHGLTPNQIVELTWETPCSDCGSIPEGLRHGAIEFFCPKQRCANASSSGRIISITPDLFEKAKSFGGLQEVGQAALEKFGSVYTRADSLPPRDQINIPIRIKRYQALLYTGWTPKEFSDHVELCLIRFMQPNALSSAQHAGKGT
jgi:hypothetical protein